MSLGFYNVDEMLDSAPLKQLREWEAFYWLEPFGGDWSRTSLATARTINTLHMIASGMGGQKMADADLIDDDAFVPQRDTGQREKQIEEQCAEADSILGF
jgi:hypothetical protein